MRTLWFQALLGVRSTLRPLGIERSSLLRRLYRTLKGMLKGRRTEVEGLVLHLDAQDSLDLSLDPNYEAFERKCLKNWIREGDLILDIGAHVGLFTLLMARLTGPGGRVFAFEPCPTTFQILSENITANGFGNIRATHAAVSSTTGKLHLHLSPENSGDHRIYSTGEQRSCVEVPSLALDSFPPLEGEKVNFIKMDIQGAEMEALVGMERLLRHNPEVRILMEFWPYGLRSFGTEPIDLLWFLRERGFRLYHLDESAGEVREVPTEKESEWLLQLEAGFDPRLNEHTNLLWIGREGVFPGSW